MKTKEEVEQALASHSFKMSLVLAQPNELLKLCKKLGWTEEYLKGYAEGVKFAYEWMLKP